MTIEEAIQTALQYENRVVGVYTEAMDQAKDPSGKKFFELLADEEVQHVKYLEARYLEWQKTGHVTPERIASAVPDKSEIEAALKALKTKAASTGRDTELRLLRRALEVEVETSGFYQRMVRELPDEGKKLFERFVEIEQGHTAIVQAEMDSIIGTGSWFGFSEWDPSAG